MENLEGFLYTKLDIYIHMHTHAVGPILLIVTLVEKSAVLQV